MDVAILPAPPDVKAGMSRVADFARWLHAHRSAVVVAGLLSFAYPLTSLAGAFGNLPDLTPSLVRAGLFRATSFAVANFPAFLVTGYVFARLGPTGWRAAVAAFALGACAATVGTSISYFGSWADMLEARAPGREFAVDTFASSLSMALIFFAHLQHSRVHDQAAKRMAAATLAQRDARRRLAQARLQAVQARIDPQLLFDMLDAVRRAYETDSARAEQLLDQLVAFLRAALPRLHDASSSVPQEAEVACACARLHALAGACDVGMALEVSAEVRDARFPPGVLLPLLNDALQACPGASTLTAIRQVSSCQVVLGLPACPPLATVERVRAVLNDLYGSTAELTVDATPGGARTTVKVPYEHA